MYSVILLENDEVMRSALSEALDGIAKLDLIGSAPDIAGGYQLIKKRPNFALVDLMLDDGLAYQFISDAVEKYETKVLIVSVLGDEASVISAIQAGASGYIKKEATQVELVNAIDAVLRGEAPMSPTIARHLLRRIQSEEPGVEHQSQNENATKLSPRERQILEALAFGMNYKEVARKYDLSHHTVAKYIKTIYRKLSVNSRAEAVIEGVKSGIISLSNDR